MQDESEQVRRQKHQGIGAGFLAMISVFLGTFLIATLVMNKTAELSIVVSVVLAIGAGIGAESGYLWYARHADRSRRGAGF